MRELVKDVVAAAQSDAVDPLFHRRKLSSSDFSLQSQENIDPSALCRPEHPSASGSRHSDYDFAAAQLGRSSSLHRSAVRSYSCSHSNHHQFDRWYHHQHQTEKIGEPKMGHWLGQMNLEKDLFTMTTTRPWCGLLRTKVLCMSQKQSKLNLDLLLSRSL